MDRQSHHLLLRVPAPTRQALSFCEASVRGVTTWLAGLPKANLGETARQLYQALIELNQLRLPSETRLQLLELLRPDVHFVCQHLEKHYLNQPIVLGERPRKVAGLCQALQNHLAVGYKLIVVRAPSQPGRNRQQLLTLALQRAIHSLGSLQLRSTQLYGPAPEGLWLELHQLYQLAVEQSSERLLVRDPLARHAQGLSAEQSYLAALLLGCARCNQMRQQSIARLAAALEAWSALVNLQPATATATGSLFFFSPQIDGPPRYRSLFADKDPQRLLGIDPRPLVERIEEHLRLAPDNRELTRLPAAKGLDDDLLRHLSSAWGDISERSFQRIPAQGSLTLCIGMTAVHYHLAGQRPFNEVLELPQSSNCAVFKLHNGAPDIWANAFDAQSGSAEPRLVHDHIEFVRPRLQRAEAASSRPKIEIGTAAASSPSESHPLFDVKLVDHSPGGYCLAWPGEVPAQLQAGELLGLRDGSAKTWSVAVVRWIRQMRGGGMQMGVELIAPRAQPCGLRLLRKVDQGSEYLRALLLPAIDAISQPAMLIAPRLPFQEGHKVQINRNGEQQRAVLSRRRAHTGNYNQFEYRSLGELPRERETPVTAWGNHTASGDEDFDSLWKSL
ncbi:molecular chaperone [Pseudomonas lopnurensis]|uniref:molecular chaperone n=1 Tax=Pseudomonas lopnurensis TaxID=1477517 RepID=UPI0028AEEACB|nr:molecular chaperone [Pseudomonas lopnurensis]